ncbi:MAG: hypothetical protein CMJ74_02075 [Planctomycetaceae bacterium]|nr:hypothetical protein [Planctomycetaceae bacterium]
MTHRIGRHEETLTAPLVSLSRHVRLMHIEAGLRTGNRHAPWPAECHRRFIKSAANLH